MRELGSPIDVVQIFPDRIVSSPLLQYVVTENPRRDDGGFCIA